MELHDEALNEPGQPVEFVKGKFGTDLPVINSFLFYQKDAFHSRFYCRTRSCRASMKLVAGPDGALRADRTPTHDHPNHAEYIATLRHIQRLREAAMNTHNKHAPSVKVCGAVRLETKTTRRRSRHQDCQALSEAWKRPADSERDRDVPLPRENTIYVNDDRSIIVFGRDWGVRVASSVRRICVDGTFRAAPTTHYQLLTFHAICSNGSSFPIIHALMTNKRAESYLVVLKQIEARARALNVRPVFCRSDVVVSVDFESALFKAFRSLGVALHGCYFHLCQAVWLFVKSHSMSLRYNTDPSFRKQVRSLTALVFLPLTCRTPPSPSRTNAARRAASSPLRRARGTARLTSAHSRSPRSSHGSSPGPATYRRRRGDVRWAQQRPRSATHTRVFTSGWLTDGSVANIVGLNGRLAVSRAIGAADFCAQGVVPMKLDSTDRCLIY